LVIKKNFDNNKMHGTNVKIGLYLVAAAGDD